MEQITEEYCRRLYSGILGKAIGIFLGHPFEGQLHEHIIKEYGEVWGYAHVDMDSIVTSDDDLTGTFLFPRAIEEYPFSLDSLSDRIGKLWLNSLVEYESVLAWSGKGIGTEHTAYLNLKNGIFPPESGSVAQNGLVMSEQVGGQIFIDAWGMLAPEDPDLAVQMAMAAASVSHDGEAVYAGCVVAAMIALAFRETQPRFLLEKSLEFIPNTSIIFQVDKALLDLRVKEPDWKVAYRFIRDEYGYNRFSGKCPVVPNHALVILALLYGEGNFARSAMIVNTCGWDSDGNSANVCTILGIMTGIEGLLEDYDFVSPMKGTVYVPFAEGGEAITDAEQLTHRLVHLREMIRPFAERPPKNPRFSFLLPYSLQGFECLSGRFNCPDVRLNGDRQAACAPGLYVDFKLLSANRTIELETRTLEDLDKRDLPFYALSASPTLYPGQEITARVLSENHPLEARLYVRFCGAGAKRIKIAGPYVSMESGRRKTLVWRVPENGGRPVCRVGIEFCSLNSGVSGRVSVDYLDWEGSPHCELIPLENDIKKEEWWRFCLVGNVPLSGRPFSIWAGGPMRFTKHGEVGVLSEGTRDWKDYGVSAEFVPHLLNRGGIALRCRGLRRYIAVLVTVRKTIQLIARYDDQEIILAEQDFDFDFGTCQLTALIAVKGNEVWAQIGSKNLSGQNPFEVLSSGAAALIVEDGSLIVHRFAVGSDGDYSKQ